MSSVPREFEVNIGDILSPGIFPEPNPVKVDLLAPTNSLLLGGTARTSTEVGRTATVKAGEDIRPALESLKSAGGGTLILLAGTHRPTYDIVLSSNISLVGEGAGKTVIDFDNGAYQIRNETVTTDSTGTITLSAGSKSVSGSGTSFTNFFAAEGETFLLIPATGQWYAIASVSSNTSLTLKDEYNGDALSGYGLWKIGNPTRNLSVRGVTVRDNSSTDLLTFDNCHRVIITDSEFDDAAFDGVEVRSSDEIEIARCKFTENGNDGVFAVTCSLLRIQDCLFINNVDGIETSGCLDTSITSCQLQGNSFYDLEINNGQNIIITGISSVNSDAGIFISAINSVIQNCYIFLSGGYGITADGNDNIIQSCSIYYSTNSGIQVNGNDCVIANCNFDLNTSGPIENNSERTVISSNYGLPATMERSVHYMKNTSGSTVSSGNVVTLKAVSTGDEVATTTTAGDDLVYGVAVTTIANNSSGPFLVLGKTTVLKVDGTTDIAIGDFLCTFTTAGIAAKAGAGDMAFAIALEAYTTDDSNGVIDALIISPRKL